jgi:hypothetical protein
LKIILNIPNEQLFNKIFWLLNHFKSEGVEITIKKQPNKNDKNLDMFENIINHKSKNSIKVDSNTILNPHNELSRDIS